jgi:HEAT repeat protein
LGTLGDATATKPLLKIVMEKDKAEIAATALLSIVKIGSGAVPVLLDVLAGKDTEMVDFAKGKAGDAGGNAKSYVAASAMALGAIGRVDARAPMIQALKASDNEMNRAVVARELTALPASPDATKAFRAGYDKVPATASIWPSMFAARPALLTASARFYDAEMVSWLLTQASAAKGKDEETMSAALGSAIKLMKGPSVAKVKTVVDKIGTDKDKSAFKAATELLGKCSEEVDCYLAKLKDDDVSVSMKAAHMVGMLGDTRAGMEVVKLLPTIANADVRAAAVLAVDHAVQKDGATVADALQKLVVDKSGDGALASTSAEQVVYRLRAR